MSIQTIRTILSPPRSSVSNFVHHGIERKAVLALAQSREIDAILVTELTRWGRSTLDLFHTLNDLQSWGVSLIAQTGLQFDLSTPQGKLIATMMSALAEFERDLLRERVRSGIAAAQKRGVVFGEFGRVEIQARPFGVLRWAALERNVHLSDKT